MNAMHTFSPSCRTIRRFLRPLFLFPLLVLPLAFAAAPTWSATSQPNSVSVQQTVGLYRKIPGLTSQQIEYGRTAIPRLHYNAQRILRKICGLPGVNFEHARQVIELLARERFTYEQVLTYEALADISSMDIEGGLAGLDTVKELSFEAGRTFRAFAGIQGVSAKQALGVISLFNNADNANNRAAQAFFAIKGMRVDIALKGMPALMRLRNNQAKAAETYARIPSMTTEIMLDGLELLLKLYQDDAWNARCLFTNKNITATQAWDWLVGYFALPTNIQEAQYDKLDPQKKTVLLQALYDGGTELLWKINNLHAVTDQNGYEISDSTLNRWSMQQLQAKYNELQPSVRARYGSLSGASRGQAISTLKQATSAARVQTARDLPLANAYAVMAQGSDLYDSSFRDIMVPVLLARINSRYQGDLLTFLRDIDPSNLLVSDFISSCAQKGKLTAFFPADPEKQKAILSLVADSAFHNEDSILLFSATLSHLLKALSPGARTHLITLMVENSEAENAVFSKLINVILQYYVQTYPELLGQADRVLISRTIVRHGAVNLEQYQITPFAEWKADGRLGSVSMYHPDDDGRQSFVSNANMLLSNGYSLVVSEQYSIPPMTPAFRAETQRWIGSGLVSLFQAMRNRHFAIAFTKQINGIQIVHTQFVYSDQDNQMEMLKRFIHKKDEMLAQRGHSYWRSEQIIEPLTKLIKENSVSEYELRDKQRFLSLGSCGGVKVYTNLTRLFASSVDILATIGTGLAMINDPYNKMFFEIIASNSSSITWKQVAQQSASVFRGERGQDYLLPGSLTAILHKILDEEQLATGAKPKSWFERSQG
jgi:protein-disulfide isomerase-like protein with CxxC motif